MALKCALAMLLLLKSHLGSAVATVQSAAADASAGDAMAAPPRVAGTSLRTTDVKEALNKTITPSAEFPAVEAHFYAAHQKAARIYFQTIGNWNSGEGLVPPGKADTEGGVCELAEGCIRKSILQVPVS